MNQEADAGDDQNHQAGQMIQHEAEVGVERSGLNPGEVVPDDRAGFLRAGGASAGTRRAKSTNESATVPAANGADDAFGQTFAEDAVDDGAEKRQQRDEPEQLKSPSTISANCSDPHSAIHDSGTSR